MAFVKICLRSLVRQKSRYHNCNVNPSVSNATSTCKSASYTNSKELNLSELRRHSNILRKRQQIKIGLKKKLRGN
jgi:hypothetical protein